MAKLVCPYCGRALPLPSDGGPVTCDGCNQPFDPAKVHFQPAAYQKRMAGWLLLAVGVLSLLVAVSETLKLDFHNRDIVPSLVGTYLLPAIFLSAGVVLKRGKLVVGDSSIESERQQSNA